MASKYLPNSAIKPNHWYIDKKGLKRLYLGIAQFEWRGLGEIEQAEFLYAKENELRKYFNADPNTIDIKDIVRATIRHSGGIYPYRSYPRHHLFVEECGIHPSAAIKNGEEFQGLALSDSAFVVFYDAFENAKPAARYNF
jgi:hypothetical protein